MLYLHEIIDIVGTGQEAYLKTVIDRWEHSEKLGISRLVGTWKVIGSTNRWPRVVNLWEMEGWSHWVDSLERQFLPEKKDKNLAPWWAKATEWRSGGFDRILEPASYSPTMAALREQKLRSWVCVHAIVRTARGQRSAFLNAVGETLRPLLARHQVVLIGAYAVPMMSDEAVLIWAAPDFRHLCGLYDARGENPEWLAWRRRASAFLDGHETMWLVPSEGCFFHPCSRNEAAPPSMEAPVPRRRERVVEPMSRHSARQDSGETPPLYRAIYTAVRRIPRGKVATYGQIAAIIGKPRAARAVGRALRELPDDLVDRVPWQRVINAAGRCSERGGFRSERQRDRLEAEGVHIDRNGKIDLRQVAWSGPSAPEIARLRRALTADERSTRSKAGGSAWIGKPQNAPRRANS